MFVICRKFNSLNSLGQLVVWDIVHTNIVFKNMSAAEKHLKRCKEWYPGYDLHVVRMEIV